MNWDDVRIFLAIARAGQLLAAAKRLGINHATVGRRLTALEQDLKAKLIDRRPNGCALTEQGEQFLTLAERMEADMLTARSTIGGTDVDLSGTVRIGASDGFGAIFLAPRLGPLLERYPDLKIELVPVPQSFSLSRREADIAITIGRPDHGRVIARKLVDYSLSLFASQTYLEQHGTPASIEDLQSHRLVSYVDDLVFNPNLHYTSEFSRNWAAQFECATTHGQMEAVNAGLGIGILHDYLVKDHHRLKRILHQHSITRSYWLVFHETIRDLQRIKTVAEFIYDLVGREKSVFNSPA
ncbi:LysR family transcriptional regulator [Coralliovum pocilloporae]|uniref:LysR family transcriptional regulator n=1 Tax=Coralliovum pocilloporae TaxID=3066369 RepID=UPI00330796B4